MVIHIETRWCSKCIRWKPETEFYVHKGRGSQSWCKECCKTAAREDRKNNRVRRDETNRLWKLNNPEKYAIVKKRQGLRKYGLTIEAYTAMLQVQFYKCAACGDKFEMQHGMQGACVDHDHDTNEVRELLCGRCNLICVRSRDEVGRLEKIIAYLKRHGK